MSSGATMNRDSRRSTPSRPRLVSPLRVGAPPRRLRDIRTLSTLRSLPRPLPGLQPSRAPRAAAGGACAAGAASGEGEALRALRAWLFLRGGCFAPGLARHPGLLQVDRQLQPEVALEESGVGLLLLAELPGVHPADLCVLVHEDVLCIESGPPLRYYRELLLPYAARLVRQELRDGLLELELVPARPSAPPLAAAPTEVAAAAEPPAPARGSAWSSARPLRPPLRPTSSAPKRRGP